MSKITKLFTITIGSGCSHLLVLMTQGVFSLTSDNRDGLCESSRSFLDLAHTTMEKSARRTPGEPGRN
jgi:hypothetical protein